MPFFAIIGKNKGVTPVFEKTGFFAIFLTFFHWFSTPFPRKYEFPVFGQKSGVYKKALFGRFSEVFSTIFQIFRGPKKSTFWPIFNLFSIDFINVYAFVINWSLHRMQFLPTTHQRLSSQSSTKLHYYGGLAYMIDAIHDDGIAFSILSIRSSSTKIM